MAVPTTSQWQFGELFPAEQPRTVLSVTELTRNIRRVLEKSVGRVWVTGEISNLSAAGSGHVYFTLKDAGGQLNCVLFRGELQADRSLLQDGRKVVLRGDVTVYEPRGVYQLRVTRVELEGLGALQVAFQKLKQKLQAEGLFAQERKRSLPRFAARIGVVTSPSGAALRDVLHVVERRNPSLEIILAPCRVQGQGAAEEIAAAVRLLNEYGAGQGTRPRVEESLAQTEGRRDARPTLLDLILVTRGGGSLEDLWAFNEEVVARAIFESALPVVSAVGHEIDFTISDFVADVRAATPSAAAEIITEGVFASYQFLAEAAGRIAQIARQQLGNKNFAWKHLNHRLDRLHPRRRFNEWLQRLDDVQTALLRCARQGARDQRNRWQTLVQRLKRIRLAVVLKQRREVFVQANERLREQGQHRLREYQNRLQTFEGRLKLLGPEQVLARGYSITMDAATGNVVRDAKSVIIGQQIKSRLRAGEVVSKVEGREGLT